MQIPQTVLRPAAILAPLAYLVAIFVQSSFALPVQPLGLPNNFDKLVHLLMYGILGFLLHRGIAVGLARPQVSWWVAAAAGAVYGITDELHQLFVPGRTCSWGDAAADGLGSLLGAFLAARWLDAASSRERTPPTSGTASLARGVPGG